MSDFSKLEALFNEQDLERRKAAEGEQQRLSHERAERGRDFDNLTAAVIAPMQELEGYLRSKGVLPRLVMPARESPQPLEVTFELPLSAAGVQAKLLVRKVGDAWEFVRHYSVSENGLPTRRHEHLGR
ncbi:hypothetical protein ACFSC4_31430 [Deinococcus malanensis]|uniref:hypothetical protein n=1 Tax=Deinococcus malanensis TaxID=1706855 RepID=UPI00364564CC